MSIYAQEAFEFAGSSLPIFSAETGSTTASLRAPIAAQNEQKVTAEEGQIHTAVQTRISTGSDGRSSVLGDRSDAIGENE